MTFCHIKQRVLVLVLTALAATAHPVSAAPPTISYHPSSSQISIDANDSPLHELMAQIASQTGVKISVAPTADQTVTIQLANESLDEALKQIARIYHLNHLFVHATTNGKSQLREMKILPRIQSPSQRSQATQPPASMTTEQRRQLIDEYKADKARNRQQQHRLTTTQQAQPLNSPSDSTEIHHQDLHPPPGKRHQRQPLFPVLNTRRDKETQSI